MATVPEKRVVQVRMTEHRYKMLTAVAKEHGVTPTDVVELCLAEALNKPEVLKEITTRIASRHIVTKHGEPLNEIINAGLLIGLRALLRKPVKA
jgi:hypothetical protein